MTDISHGYEDLGLLLKDKIAELNAKLSKLQTAQEELSAMMQWLQKMNRTAAQLDQAPAPTDTQAVRTQVEQNKSFEAELKQNVNKIQELKDKLTELLEENPHTPEVPKWKQMLTEIDSKWQELSQLTVDRQQKLEESSNNLTQFQTVEAQLKQWLVEKELMVSVLREHPSFHGVVKEQLAAVTQKWESLTGQLSDRCAWIDEAIVKSAQYQSLLRRLSEDSVSKLKSLQKEMNHHFGMVEVLNSAANSLLSICEIDREVVKDENQSLIQKVDMVTEQLHSKKLSLENMAQKFKEFQEVSREAQRQLQCAKEQLEAHNSLGPQAYSNKYLTTLQTQQKSLQTLKHQVSLAKGLAQDLVVEASDSKGTSDVLLQAETLAQEQSALCQQVADKCSFLETKLQGIGHFQNTIKEMFPQFSEFNDELDGMAPVERDTETLQKQREAIKAFLKKLEALIVNNGNANKTCKMMLAMEEALPDLVGIKRDLEALSKQCNKLLDRAQAGEEHVEETIEHLEEFYSKLKEFSALLQKAEESQGIPRRRDGALAG
ncbi:Dystonin [Manis pentadactyla]|nr:Dystonin [Manis pentadactyla]